MRRAAKIAGILGVSALLGGCSTFDHIEFSFGSTPPLAAVVSYDEIRVSEGVAVVTLATPMSSQGVMSSDTQVDLKSADPSVLGVAFAQPSERRESEGSSWTFVLLGSSVGNTTVSVRVDGVDEKQIPAIVDAQQ